MPMIQIAIDEETENMSLSAKEADDLFAFCRLHFPALLARSRAARPDMPFRFVDAPHLIAIDSTYDPREDVNVEEHWYGRCAVYVVTDEGPGNEATLEGDARWVFTGEFKAAVLDPESLISGSAAYDIQELLDAGITPEEYIEGRRPA